jgi:glycosyltransferase involved in cell wall biosynthesis
MPPEFFHWRRSANAMDLLDLENGVTPWTATRWQRALFPAEYRDDFVVFPDGVDTERFPRPRTSLGERSIGGRTIPLGTRVVSFVARSLDRLRGFDRFVALAARLLQERSDVICVSAGEPAVVRMLDLKFYGQDYAAHVLGQTPLLDPSRFWQLGTVSPGVVAELLTVTDLHVVPSRPYPVSRSMLEALGAGAVVLAWDNAAIREIVEGGRSAIIVDPDDLDSAVRAALRAIDDPAEHRPLGEAASELVRQRYDRDVTLPNLAKLFDRLVSTG